MLYAVLGAVAQFERDVSRESRLPDAAPQLRVNGLTQSHVDGFGRWNCSAKSTSRRRIFVSKPRTYGPGRATEKSL